MRYVFILLFFFLLTAMGPTPKSTDEGPVSPFEIDKLEHEKAPDFTLENINGDQIPLSSLRGKIVMINFWATWCPPCKEEMPSLNTLHAHMKSKGLEILAVSADKTFSAIKKYVAEHDFDFQILWDEDQSVMRTYKVFSLPTTFLIDRNSTIVKIFMGAYDWTDPEIIAEIGKL
jgi:peroxiredoxin